MNKLIKQPRRDREGGSALLFALGTIAVLSVVGGTVLLNCTTRYNAMSTQVGGWKDALHAAEAGGDLAFNEIRKYGLDPTTGFSSTTWAYPAPSPLPSTYSWSLGYDSTKPSLTFGPNNSLSAQVIVDRFAMLPGSSTIGYYRIRSIGTAQLDGLKRTGMDNRMDVVTKGDNLLRRVDYNVDHFISTYGFGDALATAAATTANGKAITAVKNANRPQVSRRIELIAIPIMPIEGAVKTTGAFNGTTVDSYDSQNGPYAGSNPAASSTSPYTGRTYLNDAHNGDVVDGSSIFSAGHIYGDVSTNGGNVNSTSNNITGVVDNNVPVTIAPAVAGVAPIPALPPTGYTLTPVSSGATISPAYSIATDATTGATKLTTTFWYSAPAINNMTVNPVKTTSAFTYNGVNYPVGTPVETIVNVYCTGDVGPVTVNLGAKLNIYFSGNLNAKGRDLVNNNVDGPYGASPSGNGSFVFVPSTYTGTGGSTAVSAWKTSSAVSRADHLWFYGLTPADGSARSLNINPPGDVYAGVYAPAYDFTINGNPDLFGVVVCKSYSGNGNTGVHFDEQLLAGTMPNDYRIASYIEDVR